MAHTPSAIDLYHENNVTSWSELYQALVACGPNPTVIHKATEGVTDVDPTYAERQPQAIAAGLAWQAYLFWHPDDPEAMAEKFLSVVNGGASYLWLDYEESGGTPSNIMAVLEAVQGSVPGAMGIYTTRSLAEALANRSTDAQAEYFAKHPLWLAEPGVATPVLSKPASLIWPTISLQQYTWTGRISGVSGKCDLNCIPEGVAVA